MTPPQLDLEGKVVIVTGGTMGAGKGIALRFLEAGANVTVCARHAPSSSIAIAGREAAFVETNVRKIDDIERTIADVLSRHGRLDVLVNNAGGSPPADAATASPKFSASIIDLNLVAPLNFAQQANAVMQGQTEGGCIINIGSVSGLRPSPETAAYGAAKAGLLNLTKSLAIEWAPKVRVNAIAAGMILTEKADMHFGTGETRKAVERVKPMGRMASPSDVGNVCLFLASPLASYVTGASLELHGGGEVPGFLLAAKGETP
ncbi:MAG: SDR family oxidoreductase [Myxococcota bacterium]